VTAMRVTLRCPACESGLPVAAAETPHQVTCGGCGLALPLAFSEALQRDERVDTCPLCGGGDFYKRKDFDPTLGLTVVVVGALVSAGFYWYGLDLIAYGIKQMKHYGIVDSGDSLTQGINAMTEARWQAFFKEVGVGSGVYPADLDISKVYTLRFVNHGVGLDLKKQLTGK